MFEIHEFEGTAYPQSWSYRDRDGEVWSFTGQGSMMSTGPGRSEDDAPLSWVVDFRGPLDPVR